MHKMMLALGLLGLTASLGAADALGGAAAYLRAGAGARALGMGGAAVALVDDVTATVWNPAGLSRLGIYGTQFGSMTSFLTHERSLNYLAFAQHMEGVGGVGIAVQHYALEQIEAFDAQGNSGGFFSDQELALGLSFGGLLDYRLRYGLTLRGLWQGLAEARAFGYGGDLGFQYQPSLASDFRVGLNLQNPIGSLTWDSGRQDPVAPNLKLGLADKVLEGRVAIAADLDVPLGAQGELSTHLGAELWLIQGLAARAGLNRRDITAGATWAHEFYQIDYAWSLPQNQLGDSHQLSLILRF
jgi:hypothetical protein